MLDVRDNWGDGKARQPGLALDHVYSFANGIKIVSAAFNSESKKHLRCVFELVFRLLFVCMIFRRTEKGGISRILRGVMSLLIS